MENGMRKVRIDSPRAANSKTLPSRSGKKKERNTNVVMFEAPNYKTPQITTISQIPHPVHHQQAHLLPISDETKILPKPDHNTPKTEH